MLFLIMAVIVHSSISVTEVNQAYSDTKLSVEHPDNSGFTPDPG